MVKLTHRRGRTGRHERPGLTPDDLARFRWVEAVALSPDGRRLAYTVRRPRPTLDGYTAALLVWDLETGERIPVATGSGLASGPAWSRDGSRLAYVWQSRRIAAIRVWAPDRGEVTAVPLSDAPWGLDWHPDGRRLACVRWVRQEELPQPSRRAGPTVRVIRDLRYRRDGIGFVHDRYQQVGIVDLASGHWTPITTGALDHDKPVWSRRGDRLAMVVTGRDPTTALSQGQLFVWDERNGARPLMPEWPGACRSPQWSADDRLLVFAGHDDPVPANRRIFPRVWVHDLCSGATRRLAGSLDQLVGNFAAVTDQRVGYPSPTVRVDPAGSEVYFLVTDRGAVHLYRAALDVHGDEERQAELVVGGRSVVFAYAPGGGGRVAFCRADPSDPGNVYLLEDGRTRRLTDLNPWLRRRWLSQPEEYWYADTRGEPVHAWILRPAGFTERQRYPTILYVHCSMFSWDFNHEFQCLAASGFVVACFNQWGTTAGYGQRWALGSQGDQGGRDYADIMAGVDDLVRRPFVDAERLGVTGWSCGGFLTAWIVGHTDRFKAAVTQVAIVNWVTQWAGSDGGPEGTLRETGALPWEDLDAVWRQSPLAAVARMRTPLLILHAEEDYRVPVDQAEQLFAALRWLRREVEFVRFVGEDHLYHQRGRPANRIDRVRRILDWFQRHL
ncbi:MAG: S9 family peptidase [Armatimonadota bacterium]|nr:S9 family peptidase [Armatimonadota bacterium]